MEDPSSLWSSGVHRTRSTSPASLSSFSSSSSSSLLLLFLPLRGEASAALTWLIDTCFRSSARGRLTTSSSRSCSDSRKSQHGSWSVSVRRSPLSSTDAGTQGGRITSSCSHTVVSATHPDRVVSRLLTEQGAAVEVPGRAQILLFTSFQFDRSVSGVGGQRGVRPVVQEQPDDGQVVTGHGIIVRGEASPRPVLGAAVDVGAVLQQHLDDLSPASGRRFVERRVAGVVAAVDLADVLFQTVLDHILHNGDGPGHITLQMGHAVMLGVDQPGFTW
ncbi:hypothetical protein EYF80_016989 [Liparis tanakae]|uniref:Uncharacterized protein n=1 Tax=Liparis tanakae TaxID=230148 RepID=A0A4Z2I5H1_9TELE|nr:hypothetical protein EYF80_016989 [Liparis tanakae]